MNARADIDWHNVTTYGNDYKTMAYRPIGTAPPGLNYDLNAGAWALMRTKLEAFKKLLTNWDNEGGEAPKHPVINSVRTYLFILQNKQFPPPVRLAVTSEGAIFVEWQCPGFYMDIETAIVGCADVLYVPTNGESETFETRWGPPVVTQDATVLASGRISWPNDNLSRNAA